MLYNFGKKVQNFRCDASVVFFSGGVCLVEKEVGMKITLYKLILTLLGLIMHSFSMTINKFINL